MPAFCALLLVCPGAGGAQCGGEARAGDAQTLETLARALRRTASAPAYDRLARFAAANARSTVGWRAALALGQHDYERKRYAEARRRLEQARRDPLLEEYARYWAALAARELGRRDTALAELEAHRERFPESVSAPQVVQALAVLALEANQPQRALAALERLPQTAARAELLLLRARAREAAASGLDALADYQNLYYNFALTPEADAAGQRIAALRRILSGQLFVVPAATALGRADALFQARRWNAARSAYEALLSGLSGESRDRALLRIAQCRFELRAPLSVLLSLQLDDAATDAERLFAISQEFRRRAREEEMLQFLERAVARAPDSTAAESALFAAGNYFWVKLERARAAEYYARLLAAFPKGTNAREAHWRIGWLRYLERRPEARALFQEHLRRFHGSPYTGNALYWLGRLAEREGNTEQARAHFLLLRDRFPQSYLALEAGKRLPGLGDIPVGPSAPPEGIATIAAPPPLPRLDGEVPRASANYAERAQALRSIAFDASAELELRAAYASSRLPRLLLEAARAALDAERIAQAMTTARQAAPQLEARRFEDVPEIVWRTVYPLLYREEIEKHAQRAGVDAALVAGLIRQESLFQPGAVSRAGAVGLMQVLPATGRQLARHQKLAYSRARLFDAEYNLRLGTIHLRRVLDEMGSTEDALAAYNAGESRVATWRAERSYDEPGEFVESIPLTETREYVQVVSRNAAIYRRLLTAESRRIP